MVGKPGDNPQKAMVIVTHCTLGKWLVSLVVLCSVGCLTRVKNPSDRLSYSHVAVPRLQGPRRAGDVHRGRVAFGGGYAPFGLVLKGTPKETLFAVLRQALLDFRTRPAMGCMNLLKRSVRLIQSSKSLDGMDGPKAEPTRPLQPSLLPILKF